MPRVKTAIALQPPAIEYVIETRAQRRKRLQEERTKQVAQPAVAASARAASPTATEPSAAVVSAIKASAKRRELERQETPPSEEGEHAVAAPTTVRRGVHFHPKTVERRKVDTPHPIVFGITPGHTPRLGRLSAISSARTYLGHTQTPGFTPPAVSILDASRVTVRTQDTRAAALGMTPRTLGFTPARTPRPPRDPSPVADDELTRIADATTAIVDQLRELNINDPKIQLAMRIRRFARTVGSIELARVVIANLNRDQQRAFIITALRSMDEVDAIAVLVACKTLVGKVISNRLG